MRKFYFLVLGLLVFSGVKAQIVNIPDANFKTLLLSASSSNKIAKNLSGNYFKIDSNFNNEIELTEALEVGYLDASIKISSGYSSLQGISSFINLQSLICRGNSLTLLDVSVLTNLQSLDCAVNKLSTLNVSGLTKLQSLNCEYNKLSALDVNGLTNLQSLTCNNNQLTTLNATSLTNLQSLTCNNNLIAAIDVSGLTNLNTLVCSFNQLPNLNVTGLINLKTLHCRDNKLTSLNLMGLNALISLSYRNNLMPVIDLSGHGNLEQLFCSGNKISSFDFSILPSLTILYCDNNLLETLNINGLSKLKELSYDNNKVLSVDFTGHSNLEKLYCSGNTVTNIDFTNLTGLTTLYCENNLLVDLDLTSLNNLTTLSCNNNLLKTLNIKGLKKLETLRFSNNNIMSIDLTGVINLVNFNCTNNKLITLDFSELKDVINPSDILISCISNGLTKTSSRLFSLDNNQLTYINLKASNLSCVSFSNNPNLQYICANEDQIEFLENNINGYGYTNCHVNTYCSFVPGGTFYTIQGNQKFDSNNNGCDASDIVFPNLKFSITDGTNTGIIIANANGNYLIPVLSGTQTITPVLENSTYFNISPTKTVVTFPTQTSPFIQDFCVTAIGDHPDLEVTALPTTRTRPGFDASYKIIYKNKGYQTQSGSVNLTFNDAVLDLVSVSPIVTNQSIDNLSWSFTDLKPFETREITVTVNVNGPMETPAVNGGDVLNFTATITSAATDETPADNTFTLNQTVVNAFDPNDKTCLEGTTIPPSAVGKYVHYLIRFENKGTAEAQNVVVKDMIDTSKFDINSLVVTQGSHPFVTRITETNKVEFIFENINLPFDDATNDGYVAFKIKTNPSLVVGDSFSNTASIYFDYNFPIVTNTATTSVLQSLGTNDFELESYFKIYPNPAKNVLNLDIKKQINVSSISIYNTLGQQILVIPNAQYTKQVDVSNLKTGNYFIKLISDKGSSVGKFIKN